jgi:hypothetical protein
VNIDTCTPAQTGIKITHHTRFSNIPSTTWNSPFLSILNRTGLMQREITVTKLYYTWKKKWIAVFPMSKARYHTTFLQLTPLLWN